MISNDFERELEKDGLIKVREKLATGLYSKTEIARVTMYLDSQNRKAYDDHLKEQMRIAKRSCRAAWVSAVVSCIGAIISIVFSLIMN